MGINGSFFPERGSGSARVSFASFSGGEANSPESIMINTGKTSGLLFRMKPVNFDLSVDREFFNVVLEPGNSYSSELSMSVGMESGDLAADLVCNDLLLSNIITFSGTWDYGNRWLGQHVNGGASYTKTAGRQNYAVDLAGRNPDASGEYFKVNIAGDENRALLNEFIVSAAPIRSRETDRDYFQGRIGVTGNIAFGAEEGEGIVIPGANGGRSFFVYPDCLIAFENFSLSGNADFNGDFLVKQRGGEISVNGNAVAGNAVFNGIDIAFVPLEKGCNVSLSASSGQSEGAFFLEAGLDFEPMEFEARLELSSTPADDILSLLKPFIRQAHAGRYVENILKDIVLDTEIFFFTDFKHIMYNSPDMAVVYESPDFGRIEAELFLTGTDQQFMLSEGRFSSEDALLTVSASADFSSPESLDFNLSVGFNDISWYLEGRYLDRTLTVTGLYGLHAFFTVSPSGAFSGYFQADGIPLPVQDKAAYLSFYSSVRYDSGDFWTFDVDFLEAREIPTPQGSGTLRFFGSVDQDGASLPILYYIDSVGPLQGSASFSWARDFKKMNGNVNISGAGGQAERYLADCSLENGHFGLFVSVDGMRIDRLTLAAGRAIMDGELGFSMDSLDDYSVEFRLKSLKARILENDVSSSGIALLSPDELTIKNFTLDFADINAGIPMLTLNRVNNHARLSASASGRLWLRPVEFALTVEAGFGKAVSWAAISQALDSVEGSVFVEKFQYAGYEPDDPFSFVFSHINGAFSFLGGPNNLIRFSLDPDGTFYASLSAPFPVRGTAAGSINNNYIDAHVSGLYVDLASLWNAVPYVPHFALTSGYVSGQLDILGNLNDPEFFGSVRAVSVGIQASPYVQQVIRPVPFTAQIDGNEITFGPLMVAVGGGGGIVSGYVRFDRWIPGILRLEILVPRETPIPYSVSVANFISSGDASGRLVLAMEELILDISGDLFANNSDMSLSGEDASANGWSENNRTFTTANLTVTTGSQVEFTWPNTRVPMLRANPVMGSVLYITADSQSRQYSINGNISIRSGEVFYFERSFYIRSGNLVFRESEQQDFNPLLSARAEIRDRTDTGPVTISLIVENEPLLRFAPRFESSPSLSQLEIFALLGQNLIGIQGNGAGDSLQRALLTSTSDLLAQFIGVRLLERQIRNFLRLDMFSIRTLAIQNFVLNIANIAQYPVDMSRIGNYFDNTALYGGKYIGNAMFVQGMFSMRYDENQASFGGLRFEWDIGVELQSPLFNIKWDFMPTHPENWWVNDNTITVTWNRSF
jgi:hypothetical protein